MKTLIIYGTTEGQTKKICEFIYKELVAAGHKADVIAADDINSLSHDYDIYIFGASVHIGNYQKSIRKLVKQNNTMLNGAVSVFISVSLTAASNKPADHAELDNITKQFLKKVQWTPKHVLRVAGALRYSKYNFFKKLLMKQIAKKNQGSTDTSRDYEYTDWNQLEQFVHDVILKEYAIRV